MAEQLESEILRVLTQTRDDIRANMDAKGVNASGRTSESIRVEAYEGGFRLVGGYAGTHPISDAPSVYGQDTAPIPTLETGRKEGGAPRGFYYIIREWTREKGLNFASETERSTFAYFVARKIAAEGTKRHTQPVDIYTTPVEKAKDELRQILGATISKTIRAALGGGSVQSIKSALR